MFLFPSLSREANTRWLTYIVLSCGIRTLAARQRWRIHRLKACWGVGGRRGEGRARNERKLEVVVAFECTIYWMTPFLSLPAITVRVKIRHPVSFEGRPVATKYLNTQLKVLSLLCEQVRPEHGHPLSPRHIYIHKLTTTTTATILYITDSETSSSF